MAKGRKNHTAEEKVAILRRHLVEKVPISELCEQYRVHPTLIYRWQKEFFEKGTAAFDRPRKRSPRQEDAQARRIAALEAKLQEKNEVLGELMGEHVALKKTLGEL
ncbi:MAG: transposase [Phycisphaerae bacterium]